MSPTAAVRDQTVGSGRRRPARRPSGRWVDAHSSLTPIAPRRRPPSGSSRTSGASSAAYSANAAGGSTSRSGKTRPSACGQYVPQWIGTAARGRMSRSASRCTQRIEVAAAPEHRSPAPDREEGDVDRLAELGPSRRTGRCRRRSRRSGCHGRRSRAAARSGPSGGRNPEWTRRHASTTTPPTEVSPPTASSRTSRNPAPRSHGPAPAGTMIGDRRARGPAATARRGGPSGGAR